MPRNYKYYNPLKFNVNAYSPALWLDANDLGTLFQDRTGASASTPVASNADPVGTWKDKSGNAYHYTAASDGARFAYNTNVQNSKSGLLADGVGDYLTLADAMGFSSATKCTMIVVAKSASNGGWDFVGCNSRRFAYTRNTAGLRTTTMGGSNGNYTISSTASHISTHVYDGTQTGNANRLQMYRNGVAQTLSFGGTIPPTMGTVTNWYLGCTDGTAAFLSGYLFEVLMFARALTAGELSAFYTYLGSKWGIPLA